uniref:Uncharacterized protein n=1 Tax=Anguilla anguilla TaxID=7936 RepID=A0A0E9RDR5_ANGAN
MKSLTWLFSSERNGGQSAVGYLQPLRPPKVHEWSFYKPRFPCVGLCCSPG